jgi:D-amino-acid dehydrogenase
MKKCLVIGAGINGILTALYLRNAGYDVDIIEHASKPATRATFANGCQLSFSHTTPMSISPSFFSRAFYKPISTPKKSRQWLYEHKKSQSIFDTKFKILMDCANVSKEAFDDIFLSFPNLPDGVGHSSGTAFLFGNKKQFEWRKRMFDVQRTEQNLEYNAYSPSDAVELDDAFATAQNIKNVIFTPHDKTLDALKITQFVADDLTKSGVRIFYNTQILQIQQENNVVQSIATSNRTFTGYDFYIYAGGASGLELLRGFSTFNYTGLHKVTGYSLTFDVSYSNHCPHINLIDLTNKVVYSRHGNSLRVAGFFDITPPKNRSNRIKDLYNTAISTFPILKRQDVIHQWSEERVFSYDETPCVQQVSKNFFVNTGHGHLGVTLSAGSAKKITQLLHTA